MQDSLDRLSPLLYKLQDLVKLRREQVERGEDAAVRAEVVPSQDVISNLGHS